MATTGAEIPREPAAYTPSLHFWDRYHDRYEDDLPPRHLDGEIVATCIREGEVTRHAPDSVHYHHYFGGVRYRLVADPSTREIISGYPVSIRLQEARESGRWSSKQLDDIQAFLAAKDR